eukprot:TRINITY_DN4069_c0_g1_i1.p1 TRINITY_DN4069_c0_g1~~TRINITY_DN4069_c0_g1_i1.p1  ORF type:complete len:1071 (-),score=222.90 TRINITY_DN4069_c0_g1_i1:145-3357(-)
MIDVRTDDQNLSSECRLSSLLCVIKSLLIDLSCDSSRNLLLLLWHGRIYASAEDARQQCHETWSKLILSSCDQRKEVLYESLSSLIPIMWDHLRGGKLVINLALDNALEMMMHGISLGGQYSERLLFSLLQPFAQHQWITPTGSGGTTKNQATWRVFQDILQMFSYDHLSTKILSTANISLKDPIVVSPAVMENTTCYRLTVSFVAQFLHEVMLRSIFKVDFVYSLLSSRLEGFLISLFIVDHMWDHNFKLSKYYYSDLGDLDSFTRDDAFALASAEDLEVGDSEISNYPCRRLLLEYLVPYLTVNSSLVDHLIQVVYRQVCQEESSWSQNYLLSVPPGSVPSILSPYLVLLHLFTFFPIQVKSWISLKRDEILTFSLVGQSVLLQILLDDKGNNSHDWFVQFFSEQSQFFTKNLASLPISETEKVLFHSRQLLSIFNKKEQEMSEKLEKLGSFLIDMVTITFEAQNQQLVVLLEKSSTTPCMLKAILPSSGINAEYGNNSHDWFVQFFSEQSQFFTKNLASLPISETEKVLFHSRQLLSIFNKKEQEMSEKLEKLGSFLIDMVTITFEAQNQQLVVLLEKSSTTPCMLKAILLELYLDLVDVIPSLDWTKFPSLLGLLWKLANEIFSEALHSSTRSINYYNLNSALKFAEKMMKTIPDETQLALLEDLSLLYMQFSLPENSRGISRTTILSTISHVVMLLSQSFQFIHIIPESYFSLFHLRLQSRHLDTKFAAFGVLQILVQNRSNTSLSHSTEEFQLPWNLHTLAMSPQEKDSKRVDSLAFMLGWVLVLSCLETKDGKEKTKLTNYLRQNSLASSTLDLVFEWVLASVPPPSSLHKGCPTHSIAAYLFKQFVYKLPSLCRCWWFDVGNKKLANAINQYTAKFISPELIEEEFSRIKRYNEDPTSRKDTRASVQYESNLTPDAGSFDVKVCRGTFNEVQASYTKDEVVATIVLTLADNHPLKAVTVTSKQRMGVNESTWRKWHLSMTTLLMNKDGYVLDAALLWEEALNKHFEGTELCPICYSLFHASNNSLPQMACKTCNTKFHSTCLYHWFNNSHRNDCPMCRTPFS